MPDWLAWTLLIVFAAHLVVFLRLFVVRRDPYYALVCLTFALLEATFALSLTIPQVRVAGVQVFWLTRVAAWITALISLSWYLRRRRERARASA